MRDPHIATKPDVRRAAEADYGSARVAASKSPLLTASATLAGLDLKVGIATRAKQRVRRQGISRSDLVTIVVEATLNLVNLSD